MADEDACEVARIDALRQMAECAQEGQESEPIRSFAALRRVCAELKRRDEKVDMKPRTEHAALAGPIKSPIAKFQHG